MSPKLRALLIPAFVVVPLDQLSKWWIATNVSQLDPIQVIPGFFHITHARNPGAALGLFPDLPVGVFIALTLAALGLVWSFYRQINSGDRLSGLALGLIVSGAIGNLIDRVVHQEVVDFLQFDLGLFVFPDFNVADSAIVIGVALIFLDVVTSEAEQTAAKPDPEEADQVDL